LVGKVLNGCSSSYDDIPAHRVANSQGELVARDMFGCSGEMEKLLEAEGIEIFNHRICSWRRVFWNPMMELRL
jgi:methylated-DNA-protein-cysteine methyltransferase-like protein